ncbi:hypothetical protein SLS62_003422 [Diatrype stigma]|uniref:Uncharacterized protein n=1 Tax=Diatrype stigma TaxID=117547 RepID=A0AAN9YPZ3_9PEZI
MAATEAIVQVGAPSSRLERLSAEDFETASIRSAAPSYISDAPSYHSVLPPYESSTTPAYTPTPNSRPAPLVPPITSALEARGPGLPPIPPARGRGADVPDLNGFLNGFRIPTWSTTTSNPMYARVAHRRASAGLGSLGSGAAFGGSSSGSGGSSSNSNSFSSSSTNLAMESALRTVLDRVGNGTPPNTTTATTSAVAGGAGAGGDDALGGSSSSRARHLEDPHLVGEEAAARARRARLARENGDDVLLREDQRWDWFLTQMKDREERDRSWANFRRELESGNRKRLARYIGRR